MPMLWVPAAPGRSQVESVPNVQPRWQATFLKRADQPIFMLRAAQYMALVLVGHCFRWRGSTCARSHTLRGSAGMRP